MPRPKLTVTLVGSEQDEGDVELADFRRFCDSLTLCLRRVETKFAEGALVRLGYRIVNLSHGSASLTVEPIPPAQGKDFGQDVIELFSRTVLKLQAGKPVDPRLNNDDLWAFRQLAAPMNRRVTEIRIEQTQLTSRFVANIDELVGTAIPSEGSVKGRLERLSLHNRFEFVIYPPIPGYSIKCVFKDELYERIHQAIRRNVTVYGTLRFRPGSPFPQDVHVREIEVHPPDDQLPKLAELRGAWKGSTGELSAVEFLQANRDE